MSTLQPLNIVHDLGKKENPNSMPVKVITSNQKLDRQQAYPSYPTNSLNFLRDIQKVDEINGQAKISIPRSEVCVQDATITLPHEISSVPHVKLEILVIGAGIGGLSTAIALARQGHSVRVLEQTPELGEVGAGIQVPSNSTRILFEWGLEDLLKDKAVEPDSITFRRWQTGEPIGFTKLVPEFREKYQAPYYVVHRAHFHDALHQAAVKAGVKILVGHRVVEFDESEPSATLVNGEKMKADLLIAADGIKSIARSYIKGEQNSRPIHTGFAAYRATVDVSKMKDDPDCSWLLERPSLHLWVGEGRHVMSYTIDSGNSFNMVLSHVDHSDPATWNQESAIEDMREYFRGWDPRLVKVINMVTKTMKWPLMAVAPLQNWITNSGKMVVLGDASHAMVPYMSQGAAMAVEDGAALAEALNHATSPDKIPGALAIFEKVRSKRSAQMFEASSINGKLWHFPDGVEQEARDKAMEADFYPDQLIESPNQWTDPVTQQWTYGYNAVKEVSDAFVRGL